jgi:hypothetical protein
MPLNEKDRRFLQVVDRLKVYLLIMAVTVFLYLLFAPSSEKQMTTSVIGLALCGVFWLTQRLLSFITALDLELTRVVNAVKRSLPEDQRKELFP